MFEQDGNCVVKTIDYTVGETRFRINCLGPEYRKLMSCYSQAVWGASIALANWFDKPQNSESYLTAKKRNVLELGTGTGLLGIYLALKAPQNTYTLTDLEKPSLDLTE